MFMEEILLLWCFVSPDAIDNSLCILRDEALHAEGSVLLYRHLRHKLGEARVHEIITSAVMVEK